MWVRVGITEISSDIEAATAAAQAGRALARRASGCKGRSWRPPGRSDPRVPLVAAVLPEAAAAARDVGEAFDRLDAHHVFRHLVAELALDPQPQRRAVLDGQGREVHLVGEDGLRMKGVDEVDRLVIVAGVVERLLERVGAEEGDVARLRLQARSVEERRAVARPSIDRCSSSPRRNRGG